MTQILDLLSTHWFALLFAALAGAVALVAGIRKRNVPALIGSAIALMAFALGATFLHGWTFKISPEGTTRTVAFGTLVASLAALYVAVVVLLLVRRWSFWLVCFLGFVAIASFGGVVGRGLGTFFVESGKSIAWTRFVSPWWLIALLLAPLIYFISRTSLSGLGPVRRWVAIAARTLVVIFIALALAEPRIKRPSENMTVIFVVDRSASVPREREETQTGDSLDRRFVRIRNVIESAVTSRYGVNRSDQFGVIFFGKRPKLAYPPAPVMKVPIDEQAGGQIDENYTDVAAAMKLALASFPEGTGKRIVLISDGNQNLGNAEEQADLARKNGVPVDTIALAPGYRNENEVLVQSVEAPPVAVIGTRPPIRVYVRNAHPTRKVRGSLQLIRVGGQGEDQPLDKEVLIDIEDGIQVLDKNARPPKVILEPGLNVFKFRDREQARADTSYTYRASFVPDVPIPDDRIANNTADAAVVARGTKKVLFLDQAEREADSKHRFLLEQLRKAKIQYVFRNSKKLPNGKTDLGIYLSNFDCLILSDVPADDFTNDQMEVMRTQVYDQGCGLVMIGGPDSFGPGGYQQTPVEAALPVECEIKAKKAMGKGGLVLIMHASEMADGNKWQKEIAKLAIQRLNPADMVGVVDFGFLGGAVNWQIPFSVIGDQKQDMYAKVDKMNPGDMPDFDPFLQAAADTLADPKHNLSVKHCILISDGDPNFSNQAALAKMAANGITCTTIGVATHGVNEDAKMKLIAESTKDANGKPGNFHKVTDPKKLPAIYIKETRKISQSFIYDKPFDPQLRWRGGPTDGLADDLPRMYGFVRTTNKQSPTQLMQIEGPTDTQADQQFPILSTWRYGLGKAVAFTSDARDDNKAWGRDWASKGIYQGFWEKTINWAMREAESGELAVTTQYIDGKVRVTVSAENQTKDSNGKPLPLPGLTLRGGVTAPGKALPGDKVPSVVFKPTKSGFYEAEFDATEAGAYFLNLQAETDEIGSDGKPVIDPKTGKVKRRAFGARAGVTVPYSPEFVDLESNTSLMKHLAEMTDGKYFEEPENPFELAKLADFFRAGPEVVRSILPFWFWLVFAAGLLLLLDVGVRRISLEFKEVRSGARVLWAKLRRNEDLVEDADGMLGKLGQRKQATAGKLAKRAAKKFDAGEGADDAAPEGADDYSKRKDAGGSGKLAAPPTCEAPTEPEEDDFMARMRKAKERGNRKPDGS